MSATDLQALIRFLAQDAKIPLAMAMGKIKQMQQSKLDTIDILAKTKIDAINVIFEDEKLSKQVLNAAKRVSKKRVAGEDLPQTPKKKAKEQSLFSLPQEQSDQQLEESLQLPSDISSAEDLNKIELFSNRAPLVLAMTVVLLKYTMPEQPLSSRLSLAQAYVSTTSRSRAVSLGLQSGKSADEEGYGKGQPSTSIMGKQLFVLRRWTYDNSAAPGQAKGTVEEEADTGSTEKKNVDASEEKPALWGLDLEALKKAETGAKAKHSAMQSTTTANMPIYLPASARAYLLKSFETPRKADTNAKKLTAAQLSEQKAENLGRLLRAIDLLYQSWLDTIGPDEIEKRVWSWYVKARPDVEPGAAGWGGKNVWKLADLLSSMRDGRKTLDSFIKKETVSI